MGSAFPSGWREGNDLVQMKASRSVPLLALSDRFDPTTMIDRERDCVKMMSIYRISSRASQSQVVEGPVVVMNEADWTVVVVVVVVGWEQQR